MSNHVELAEILGIHPETMRIYLRRLAELGMVTRTHRFRGWTLAAGGRQMVLGQAVDLLPEAARPALPEGMIDPSAENPFSGVENLSASAENPRSGADNPSASAENPRSSTEISPWSAENPRSDTDSPTASAENPRSSAENPRSPPAAAASLSLIFKEEKKLAAAAITQASAENPSSRLDEYRGAPKEDRTASGRERSDPVVRANLQAFASFGLFQNRLVLEICKMDHVTPDYILGQKKRLEAERRYSHALLLTVVRCNDKLPAKYLPRVYRDSHTDNSESEPEPDEGEVPEDDAEQENVPSGISRIEPDPSIHEALAETGMTAARAWEAARWQLQRDMPKSCYDGFVRDLVLLSARDGTFVIGAGNDYAREWMESRMTSSVRRLLTGICNRSVEVRFISRIEFRPMIEVGCREISADTHLFQADDIWDGAIPGDARGLFGFRLPA